MKKDKEKKKKREKHAQQSMATAEKPFFDGTQEEPLAEEPLQYLLTVVGGKWKIRILWALRSGISLRYGEIKQQIPSITDMMLSQSLREMTASELIVRRQFQQIPPKVEYNITQAGMELIPAVELLRLWAAKQIKKMK